MLVGRQEPALAEAAAAVRAAGGQAATCRADVTAADAPDRIVAAALAAFGGIDVLVNAAGVIASGALEATTDEVWDAMMAVNLRAPFRLMRAAAPHLDGAQGRGRQRVERQRPAIVSRRARLLRRARPASIT